MKLRCTGRLHGVIDLNARTLEVKCDRRQCGHSPGSVVLHTFDLESGRLLGTQVFQDPSKKGT